MNVFKSKSSFGRIVRWIIAGVVVIGFLAIGFPRFLRARNTHATNSCINWLRQIDGAKQQWALENKQVDTALPSSDDVCMYLKNNNYPRCPGGGKYTIGQVNEDPTCSLGIPVWPDSLFFGSNSYFFNKRIDLGHKLPLP
jgi:hypothetical protein